MSRSFKNVTFPSEGVYHGDTPATAARKAFSLYCRDFKPNSACRKYFEIRETTRGSAKKVFCYVGSRKLLSKPLHIVRDGEPIEIRYKVTVKKASHQ